MSRYGDLFKPSPRDEYDSSRPSMPFREWLRQSAQPEPHDEQLSDFVTRGIEALNRAAQVEMDRYLNGGKKPKE